MSSTTSLSVLLHDGADALNDDKVTPSNTTNDHTIITAPTYHTFLPMYIRMITNHLHLHSSNNNCCEKKENIDYHHYNNHPHLYNGIQCFILNATATTTYHRQRDLDNHDIEGNVETRVGRATTTIRAEKKLTKNEKRNRMDVILIIIVRCSSKMTTTMTIQWNRRIVP
jgi:hypothetical protein